MMNASEMGRSPLHFRSAILALAGERRPTTELRAALRALAGAPIGAPVDDSLLRALCVLARVQADSRAPSLVPPSAAVALRPTRSAGGTSLLMLVPNDSEEALRGRRIVGFLGSAIADLGLTAEILTGSVDTVVAGIPAAGAARFAGARFVCGRHALFAALTSRLAAFAPGPQALVAAA